MYGPLPSSVITALAASGLAYAQQDCFYARSDHGSLCLCPLLIAVLVFSNLKHLPSAPSPWRFNRNKSPSPSTTRPDDGYVSLFRSLSFCTSSHLVAPLKNAWAVVTCGARGNEQFRLFAPIANPRIPSLPKTLLTTAPAQFFKINCPLNSARPTCRTGGAVPLTAPVPLLEWRVSPYTAIIILKLIQGMPNSTFCIVIFYLVLMRRRDCTSSS